MIAALVALSLNMNVLYIQRDLPPNMDTWFKSFMDYRAITDTTSMQWNIQQKAYTDEQGFRRINDDYLVAMGTYYAEECGTRFEITLENGQVFNVQVGEIKNPSDEHTDDTNMYHKVKDSDGNVIGANILEFIVDSDVIDMGVLMTYGTVCKLGFEGNIIEIKEIVNVD